MDFSDHKFNSNFDTTFTEGSEIAISDQMLAEMSLEEIGKVIGLDEDLKLQEIEDEKEFARKKFAVVKVIQARDYARITVGYPLPEGFNVEKAGKALSKHLLPLETPIKHNPIIIDLNSEQGQRMIKANPHLFNGDGSLNEEYILKNAEK